MLISKKMYIGIYAASFGFVLLTWIVLGAGFVFGSIQTSDETAIAFVRRIGIYASLQFAIVHSVYNCLLLHRMWCAIQDGQTSVTARMAIGFLFIPLFNIYWIFRAWASFPTEYNNYIDRYALPVEPLAGKWFVAYPILILLAAILYVPLLAVPFVFIVVATNACAAVSRLDEAVRTRRGELAAAAAAERLYGEKAS
jgi:hypothetical protein